MATGSVPKPNAVVIVNGSKIVNVFTAADNSKYHDYYYSRHNVNMFFHFSP